MTITDLSIKITDSRNDLLNTVRNYLMQEGINPNDIDFTYDRYIRISTDEKYLGSDVFDELSELDGLTVDISCDKYSLINLN